jgi:hypothetical protein
MVTSVCGVGSPYFAGAPQISLLGFHLEKGTHAGSHVRGYDGRLVHSPASERGRTAKVRDMSLVPADESRTTASLTK